MSTQKITNVIIAGASGTIGTPIMAALISSKLFKVSALSRPGSKATFPDGVEVKRAELSDHAGLLEALKGQDALISTLNDESISFQIPLFDAAIQAGVKRILPNEWATHQLKSANKELDDMVSPRRPVIEFLTKKGEEAEAAGKEFHWTGVDTGMFFDWCLQHSFMGITLPPGKKATVWDNGTTPFSATNLSTVATAVVKILSTAEAETRNRFVAIESFLTTQNEIVATLEAVSGQSWNVTQTTTKEQLTTAKTLEAAGQWLPAMFIKILALIYEPNAGAEMSRDKLDNELLGLPKENIQNTVARVLRETK